MHNHFNSTYYSDNLPTGDLWVYFQSSLTAEMMRFLKTVIKPDPLRAVNVLRGLQLVFDYTYLNTDLIFN